MDMNFISLPNISSFHYTDCAECLNTSYLFDSASVIDSAVMVFKKYFRNLPEELFIINNHPNFPGPQAFPARHLIFLTISAPENGGGFWSQFVYQFSHELCHCLVFRTVPDKLLWFEESICELASHFLLLKIAEHWAIHPPHENWRSYASCFMSYEFSARKCNCFFPISELLVPQSAILQSLEADEYQRELNRNVALKLLPFFIDNSELWNIIYYLPDALPDHSFPENLQLLQMKSRQPIYDIIRTL